MVLAGRREGPVVLPLASQLHLELGGALAIDAGDADVGCDDVVSRFGRGEGPLDELALPQGHMPWRHVLRAPLGLAVVLLELIEELRSKAHQVYFPSDLSEVRGPHLRCGHLLGTPLLLSGHVAGPLDDGLHLLVFGILVERGVIGRRLLLARRLKLAAA